MTPSASRDPELVLGDSLEALSKIETASVDAVVTDPPYGIGFMGHEWDQPGDFGPVRANGEPGVHRRNGRRARQPDATGYDVEHGAMRAGRYDLSLTANRRYQAWVEAWATEALRVLRPGGYLLSFGGTRTYHRLASGVEDAGFEVRDCLAWLFGSGFPKSRDVSKAIDALAGAERQVVGSKIGRPGYSLTEGPPNAIYGQGLGGSGDPEREAAITAPATEDAARWAGWGTALKPALEPIVVARKPLSETNVARNVLAHGTGALNIGGCLIPFADAADEAEAKAKNQHGDQGRGPAQNHVYGPACGGRDNYDAEGRWPANVLLDELAAEALDEQTGILSSGNYPAHRTVSSTFNANTQRQAAAAPGRTDTGGASRFFYCAKASRLERNAGLDGFEKRPIHWSSGDESPGTFQSDGTEREARNHHPTVKPIDLMRWLVRLVTPPGGRVLDPFLGSGTTGIAAGLEGFRFVGIERDPDYLQIAAARIAYWREHGERGLEVVRLREQVERRAGELEAAGQERLFG